MKKIIIVLLLVFSLVGCGKEQNTEINEKNIVYSTVVGQAEYVRNFSDMKELAEVSDLVIYGEVVDSHCEAIHGSVYTLEDIRVDQVLQGSIEVGNTVQIIKQFGIVTLEEYINSLDEDELEAQSERFSQYSSEEQKKLYVNFVAAKEIESEIGQKCVYFIKEVQNFYDYQGYFRITESQSQYLEIANGEFASVYNISDDCEGISEYTEEEIVMSGEIEEMQIYTIESIQKEMEEGVDMEGVIPR